MELSTRASPIDAIIDTAPPRTSSPTGAMFKRFCRSPLGLAGSILLACVVICAIFAPLIAPYDPAAINWDHMQSPPSSQFWFGTDEIGRDVFSRVVYGARISLWVVAVSIAGSLVLGSLIGLIAGYFGGVVDDVIMRLNDALLAMPMLILALGIVAALGPNLTNSILAIAIVNVPGFSRVVRAQVLSVRELELVEAARAIGAGPVRIMALHIWPYVSGNVIVYASLRASAAIITESALAFLGLGVQPPTPTWGSMLSNAMGYLDAWWISFFPGLAIFVAVLGFNFLGDALLDARSNAEMK